MDLSRFSGWLLLYRSPATRAGYLYDLALFLQWADGDGVYSEITARYLARWLDVRAPLARCPQVFVNLHHGTALTTSGLRVIMRRIARAAGLPALSPHDLRRTFATLATLAGAPTRTTQIGGRWRSIVQVETYTASLAIDAFRPYSPVIHALGREGT